MNADIRSVPDSDPASSRTRFRIGLTNLRRRAATTVLLILPMLFVWAWTSIVFTDWLNSIGVRLHSPWRLLPLAGLVLFVIVTLYALQRVSTGGRLRCPACGHPLTLARASYIAMVTGRCPKCAVFLFEEDESRAELEVEWRPHGDLLSRGDLLAAEKCALRSAVRPTLVWGLSGVVLLIAGTVSTPWLSGLWAERLGEVWTPLIKPLAVLPGISIAASTIIVWIRHVSVARPCPSCSADIAPHGIATVTGNCSTCGKPAVGDPFPGMCQSLDSSDEPSWSTDEFRNLARGRHDRLWVGCLVGGAFAAAGLIPFLGMISQTSDRTASPGELAILFVCLGLLVVLQCGGVILWQWNSARGLRCPKCNGELVHLYGFVISSRRCYHCGATVLKG